MNAVNVLLNECNKLSNTYHREYIKWLVQFNISDNSSNPKTSITYENICKPDQPVLQISEKRHHKIMKDRNFSYFLTSENCRSLDGVTIYDVKIKIKRRNLK